MKSLIRLVVFACFMSILGAEEEEYAPPDYQLASRSDFPTRPWKVSEKEQASWKGDFAPALTEMLRAGFPDPAGLPYHRIIIYTGNAYCGFEGETQTEAWILPGKKGEPIFAIAWNGLIYPVVKDLGAADLTKQVAAMRKAKKDDGAHWFDLRESTQVRLGTMISIHGLYLTRFGFPDAAKHVLATRNMPLRTPALKEELILQWLWNLYERSITAHMRGDPNLALASLAVFKKATSALEKSLAAMDPMFGNVASWREDVTILEAECHRRLQSDKVGYFDEKAFAAKASSVKELIDALDRIALPQDGQPGDVPLWESAIVKRLVAMGDDAVEPLLICLEKDMRLTQSVHFWREHHKGRTLLGVHEAALYALQAILQTDYFQLASTGDSLSARELEYRQQLAKSVRSNWEKYGKTAGPNRAFKILLDDAAGMDAWIQAGEALLPQVDYDEEKGEYVPRKGPMPGEPLRSLANPSVSDLLLKRAMVAADDKKSDDSDAKRNAYILHAILLDWDQERGRLAIKDLAAGLLEDDAWLRVDVSVLQGFIRDVADKAPEIFPVFEAMAWWLLPTKYPNNGMNHRSTFVTDIISKHAKALKRSDLWTSPDSPWCLHQLPFGTLQDVIGCWKDRDLLHTSPFKEHVRDLLRDDSPCEKIIIEKDKPTVWRHEHFDATEHEIPKKAKLGLKPGEIMTVRRKDVVAKVMTEPDWSEKKQDDSDFAYYWPVQSRDEFIARLLEKMK